MRRLERRLVTASVAVAVTFGIINGSALYSRAEEPGEWGSNGIQQNAQDQTQAHVESHGNKTTGTLETSGHAGSSTPNGSDSSSSTTTKTPDASKPTSPHAGKKQPTKEEIEAYREAMALWAHRLRICQRELDIWGSPGIDGSDCVAKAGPPPAKPKALGQRPAAQDQPPPPDPAVLAQRAVATLTLPKVTPEVGPPPSVNQWNIAVVGYPLWLWTSGPSTHAASVTLDGVTLTLTARRVATRFDMGEPGAKPVVCTTTTAWRRSVATARPSPTCGYVYEHASITQSAPDGTYTVTATERWEVTWTALGASGVIPLHSSGTGALPVGEIQTVRLP